MNIKSLSAHQMEHHIQSQVFSAQNKFLKKELRIEEIGAYLPGSVMVQDLRTLCNTYMNEKGCEILGRSKEELEEMGAEYFKIFFPPEEVHVFLTELRDFAAKADQSIWHSFFQRVRAGLDKPYHWYFTTSRLYRLPGDLEDLSIMHVALPVNPTSGAIKKLDTIAGDTEFIQRNLDKYKLLSRREKEIISLIAAGKSSLEISDELFISIHTVNNHRKNIIAKLADRSLYKLMKFADAFGIITA